MAPFGFCHGPRGELVPEPREQYVIRSVRKALGARWSLGGISRELAKRGYLNRRGKPFDRTSILRISGMVPLPRTAASSGAARSSIARPERRKLKGLSLTLPPSGRSA
jgi:hypothetical protein